MAELVTEIEYLRWLDDPVTKELMKFTEFRLKCLYDAYIDKAAIEANIPILNQMRGAMQAYEDLLDPLQYEVINNSGETNEEDDINH